LEQAGTDAMIELPSWFLIMVGIAMFTAVRRKRKGTAFLYDEEPGPAFALRSAEATPDERSDCSSR
jgi:hypothetical protein